MSGRGRASAGLICALALDVIAQAISSTSPGTLYAGTGGGVFKSTDSGGRAPESRQDPERACSIVGVRVATIRKGRPGGGHL